MKKSGLSILLTVLLCFWCAFSVSAAPSRQDCCSPQYSMTLHAAQLRSVCLAGTGDAYGARLNREAVNLYAGECFRLAMADGRGGLSFTTENESVASVDPTGLIVARNEGTTQVTCKYGDKKQLKCKVTVRPGKGPAAVTLNHQTLTLLKGESDKLDARVLPDEGDAYRYFVSSDPDVVTVDQQGNLKAAGVGTAVITVESASSAVSAGCFVRVVSTAGDAEALAEISGTLYDAAGEKMAHVSLELTDGQTPARTTTDSSGQFAFHQVIHGSYVLTVYDANGSQDGISASVRVYSKDIHLNCIVTDHDMAVLYGSNSAAGSHLREIHVVQKNVSLNSGDTYDISYLLTPSNAANVHLLYQSKDPSIACVDETGRVTALNDGGTEIIVTSDDGTISDSLIVHVSRYGTGIFGAAVFMMLLFIVILIITVFIYLRKKESRQ